MHIMLSMCPVLTDNLPYNVQTQVHVGSNCPCALCSLITCLTTFKLRSTSAVTGGVILTLTGKSSRSLGVEM